MCIDLGGPAAAGKRNGGLVEDKRADVGGQKCGFQGTKSPERMPENMHRAADGVDNRGDIFALALKRVVIPVTAAAASSPVNCSDAELLLKHGLYRRPRTCPKG